ncbi:MAG: hypothetical protein SFV22_03955 [Saprospiraceae bacterium]|nr:hypothetical protein [Saprospiraceae bacterium]
METIFLDFKYALDVEWMSEVASVAVTFVVFIMGVPALISQTFIPDPLRSVYRRRLDGKWSKVFAWQIGFLFMLLLLSFPGVSNMAAGNQFWEWTFALVLLGISALVLILCAFHLVNNFKESQNIGERLARNIVKDAITCFDQNRSIPKTDLEDLGLLARELPMGTTKTFFLEETEKLMEHLLDYKGKKDMDNISQILEKVVCPSINTDGTKANEENIRKALDMLLLAYHKIHQDPIEKNSYLIQKIGGYIREIGTKVIQRGDLSSFMYATDKLSQIEGASKEMYTLGDAALKHGYMPEAVAMVRNLSSRVRQQSAAADLPFHKDKRSFSWLGLIARIYIKDGWARNFAERQLTNLLKPLETQPEFMKSLFNDAQVHFYRQADFSTADAILELQQKRYPTLTVAK